MDGRGKDVDHLPVGLLAHLCVLAEVSITPAKPH